MVDNRDMSFAQRYIDRELENLKNNLWNAVVGMSKPRHMVLKDGLLFCPACGKFFSDDHAEHKPNFCEECGQAFEWEGER